MEKTCALVCAAAFASEDFLARRSRGEFDAVVAVDSGFARLEEVGVAPDVALGDFDSLGYVPDGALVHPAIKDKSDLELALAYAAGEGCADIVVYGCLGGRLDHTLAALQNLAAAAEAGARVRAVDVAWGDEGCANSRRPRPTVLEVLSGPATLALEAKAGAEPEEVAELGAPTFGSVSVFAASDAARGVVERGMYYPLDADRLTNRTSLGLSNELVERAGSVSVESGTLFVLYPADLAAVRA